MQFPCPNLMLLLLCTLLQSLLLVSPPPLRSDLQSVKDTTPETNVFVKRPGSAQMACDAPSLWHPGASPCNVSLMPKRKTPQDMQWIMQPCTADAGSVPVGARLDAPCFKLLKNGSQDQQHDRGKKKRGIIRRARKNKEQRKPKMLSSQKNTTAEDASRAEAARAPTTWPGT
jgi:hypothetical protein